MIETFVLQREQVHGAKETGRETQLNREIESRVIKFRTHEDEEKKKTKEIEGRYKCYGIVNE